MAHMSPKIVRLPSQEFSSRRFSLIKTPYFSIRTKKNGSQARRLGVVAGKAAGKTAVERNFLKRQARASLGSAIFPGNDMLIVFSPSVRQLTKRALKEALAAAARNAQS